MTAYARIVKQQKASNVSRNESKGEEEEEEEEEEEGEEKLKGEREREREREKRLRLSSFSFLPLLDNRPKAKPQTLDAHTRTTQTVRTRSLVTASDYSHALR